MKNNFLKNGKSVLSLVVAFAVIAVSLFTVVPGINLGANAATVEDTWDGTMKEPTDTDANGNIIINTAEELAWVALKGTTAETADKNYKVVDNAVFNLNGMTGITLDSTAGDVSAAAATANVWKQDEANRNNGAQQKSFAGNFDGNGVILYNMYASDGYSGLFPHLAVDNTTNTCNFSGITIKASYIKAYHYSAAFVGLSNSSGSGRKVNFTDCKVENCYINAMDSNPACSRTGALFVGGAAHCKVTINNGIAVNNVIAATDIKGGFVGETSAHADEAEFKNSVVIGSTPYAVVQEGSSKSVNGKANYASCFSNVYTDQDVASAYTGYVTKLSLADMKGSAAKANMPSLDWSKLIAFDGEYPDLRVTHNLTTTSNGDSGHSISCSKCGKSLEETHNLVDNFDTMVSSCACGYEKPITQMKDSWDGTQATAFAGGTGTKDDPYIIKTAEQMAYVALSTTLDSKGKYFKVTDNAVFNMNGAIGITLNSTAAEIKSAPKNGVYKWTSDGAKFNGNFDGNGVIIYNVYGPQMGYGGLFPNVNTDNDEKTVTIKNVAVKASYFAGYHCAGGIVGNATAITTSQNLVFENCMVENCYMTDAGDTNPACSRTAGTIVGRVAHNKAIINNCLAKGNLLETINIVGGFVGNTSHYAPKAEIKNSVSIGTLPYPTASANTSSALEEFVTSADCYNNVYTDKETSAAYNEKQIKCLTTAEMSGATGLEKVALDFAGVWFANAGTPELQVFHNLKGAADTTDAYAGHTANCEDCGLQGVGLSDHIYDDAYTCTVCGFTCAHKNDNHVTDSVTSNGDCVTDPYVEKSCACGYTWTVTTGTASGHNLTKTTANEATCAKDGNVEYWTCSTCNKIFLSDDKMAAMDTAVTADDVVLSATGAHVELRDDNGNLVYLMDENSHSTYCKVCQTKITTTAHEGEFEKDENGHSGKCRVCEYGTEENAPHTFGDDSSCDICEWTCTQHIVKAGDVKVEGDCVTDKVTAQYCDRCKVSLDDKVESAKGHTLVKTGAVKADCSKEGNVDYWTCSDCEKIFLADDKMAAMDTAVKAEDVVVAKTPHNYVGGEPTYTFDEVAHWFECEDCGKAEYTEHTLETDTDCEGVYKWCEDADGNSCGYETFEYSYSSDDGSASVVADANAFTKDVVTDLIQITTET